MIAPKAFYHRIVDSAFQVKQALLPVVSSKKVVYDQPKHRKERKQQDVSDWFRRIFVVEQDGKNDAQAGKD